MSIATNEIKVNLYNTKSRKKELLQPVRAGKVYIYVCGVTVYDYCHIGHARSALVFDVLVRHLRYLGLEVTFIRNFTDIDDKIINRAKAENKDWQEIASTYIDAFHADMQALGTVPADLEPKATEYIPQMQEICTKIVENDKAYSSPSGDLCFRVRAHNSYGSLSGRSLDDLQAGARVAKDEDKEDPLDFVLWKAAKPGEPAWASPWGQGRPGWHIECSAMTLPWLPLDIHGGGQDLIFPHHENEMAQTEAATNQDLAKIWMHNGFVQVNAEKMSKSLGNFTTIRDILQNWLPETLRFFLLGRHYRTPIDFTFENMQEAEKAQQRVYACLLAAQKQLENTKWKKIALPSETLENWQNLHTDFLDSLDDDLNTAKALGEIFSQVHIISHLLEDKQSKSAEQSREILAQFLERAKIWQANLGLFGQKPEEFLAKLKEIRIKRLKIDLNAVENLLEARQEARKAKDFAKSDSLRDQLASLGISVRDTPNGQVWDIA